jgi:hypothetical protein
MTRGSFLGDKVIGEWSKSWALKVELRHLGRGRILYSLSYDNGELNCSERVNREIFEGREAAGERCPDVVVLEIGYLNTGGGLWLRSGCCQFLAARMVLAVPSSYL